MQGYLQVGGVIIGITVGEGTNGTTDEYLINTFKITGVVGKRADTGKSNKLGMSKV